MSAPERRDGAEPKPSAAATRVPTTVPHTIAPNTDLEPITTADDAVLLTEAQARDLTTRIREVLINGPALVVSAWRGRAWLPLGYSSWDAYCAGEFTDTRALRIDADARRGIVEEMRAEGMSVRAIAGGLGVSVGTVHSDATASVQNRTDDRPAMTTSLDGRQRPATRPTVAPAMSTTASEPSSAIAPAPRRPSRRPLGDVARDLSFDLGKVTERVRRLTTDDRLTRNRDDVAARLHHELAQASEVCQALLDTTSDGPASPSTHKQGSASDDSGEVDGPLTADTYRQVREALDRHTDDSAHRLALWHKRFLAHLQRAGTLTAWPAEDIAANADEQARALHAEVMARLVAHHARATAPSAADATVIPLGSPRAARDGRTR